MYKPVDNLTACLLCAVPSHRSEWWPGECRSANAVKPQPHGLGWPLPSCMMTKLSLVGELWIPSARTLCSALEIGNRFCQLQGEWAKKAKESKGGGFLSWLIFGHLHMKLQEVCSEDHCTGLLSDNKEITSRWGHSAGVSSLWFPARQPQFIKGGFVK